MINGFEDFQKLGKANMDVAVKSFGNFSKSMQTIALEMADFSKRSFEEGAATAEKLAGAKSLDKAFEIQADYVKNSYEGFVAQATRFGELYVDLAKEAYRPLETVTKNGK